MQQRVRELAFEYSLQRGHVRCGRPPIKLAPALALAAGRKGVGGAAAPQRQPRAVLQVCAGAGGAGARAHRASMDGCAASARATVRDWPWLGWAYGFLFSVARWRACQSLCAALHNSTAGTSRPPALPPRACSRLLPALLHFGDPGGTAAGRAEALKYVRFCWLRLGSEDPAVHNLAVALLSLDASQVSLALRPYNDAGRPADWSPSQFDGHVGFRQSSLPHLECVAGCACACVYWQQWQRDSRSRPACRF